MFKASATGRQPTLGRIRRQLWYALCQQVSSNAKTSEMPHLQIDERIFISGQIGLIPSNLTLPTPRSLAIETALCFQHAERIERALLANVGAEWDPHAQIALYWIADANDIPAVKRACSVYEPVCDLSISSYQRY
jgi:enamine deaminase RidA (YjgF/YER057c/UK114 family)